MGSLSKYKEIENRYEQRRRKAMKYQEWQTKFMQFDQDMLFKIILAANYLDIEDLLDSACKAVANMMQGRSTEELRQVFEIPEEEWIHAEDLAANKLVDTSQPSSPEKQIFAQWTWPNGGYTFVVQYGSRFVLKARSEFLRKGANIHEAHLDPKNEHCRDITTELDFLKDPNVGSKCSLVRRNWTAGRECGRATQNSNEVVYAEFKIGGAVVDKVVWLSDFEKWQKTTQASPKRPGCEQPQDSFKESGTVQLSDLPNEILHIILQKVCGSANEAIWN